MKKALKKNTLNKSVSQSRKSKKSGQRHHIINFYSVLGLLLLSLFITVILAQQQQNLRSKAQTLTNCTISEADVANDSEEQKMLDQLNAYRQMNGVPPLKFSPDLNRAAAWQSNDMAVNDNLSHTDSLGRDFSRRAQGCGADALAENVAQGNTDATSTMDQWKTSPGHNKNMLRPDVTHTGIARKGEFWTQVFGTQDETKNNTVPTPTSATAPTIPMPTSTQVPPQIGLITPTFGMMFVPSQAQQQPPAQQPTSPAQPTTGNQERPKTSPPASNSMSLLDLLIAFIKALLSLFRVSTEY